MKSAPKRLNHHSDARKQNLYVDGSTARRLEVAPQKQKGISTKKTVSTKHKQVRREKALPMNRASVLILAIASIVTVVLCAVCSITNRNYDNIKKYQCKRSGTGELKRA